MQPFSPDDYEDSFQVKIDNDADAAYVRLHRRPVARTERFDGSEHVMIDIDGDDHLVGVEVLGLKTTDLPIAQLANRFNLSESVIQLLKEASESIWRAGFSVAVTNGGLIPRLEWRPTRRARDLVE